MNRSGVSRLIPIILIVVVVIVAIAALVGLGRAIFGGGSSAPDANQTRQTSLLNTDGDRSVSMTVRGPIVAEEDFRTYTIEVSPSERSITEYQGYQKDTTAHQAFANNQQAYAQFVHALNKANLVKGDPFSDDKDDTRGICATGKLYEFDLFYNDSDVTHLWTSTCNGSRGSLRASLSQVRNLFIQQIPDDSDILSRISLD